MACQMSEGSNKKAAPERSGFFLSMFYDSMNQG